MSNTRAVLAVLTAASLAIPATAGAWPNVFTRNTPATATQSAAEPTAPQSTDEATAHSHTNGAPVDSSLTSDPEHGCGMAATECAHGNRTAAEPVQAPDADDEPMWSPEDLNG